MSIKPLILILFAAFFVRFWNLGNYPPTLTQDEASLGYNAYSILKTGRDEYGEILPIIFKSFGDYKPGLYVYLAIPAIAIFGLNEWTVRVPSALAGVFSVFLIFRIVEILLNTGFGIENLKKSKQRVLILNRQKALAVAFVAAMNPWLIHFSRGGWESNVSLTLTLAGILFFLKSLKETKFLIFSCLFFSLTLVTYQGAKLSTSIVVFVLIVTFFNDLKRLVNWTNLKVISVSLILAIIIAVPVIASFFTGQTGRLTVFSIFSYPRPPEYTELFLEKAKETKGTITYFLYHSESLNFLRGIMGRWFNHFSGRFLFFEGDYQNPRHSAPNHGMMLLVDFIFLPLGLIMLFRSKKQKFLGFIFLWLLLSSLPAALTRDQVHSVRALNMSIPLVTLSGLGLYFVLQILGQIRNLPGRFIAFSLLVILVLFSLIYYFDSYFTHLYKHNARYWFYGYKETIQLVSTIRKNYDKVIFQHSYNQPYIYFLFFEAHSSNPDKYDPRMFQNEHIFKSGGSDVGVIEDFENIDFQFFSWPPHLTTGKTLIVGDTVVIPDNYDIERFNLIHEVKFPDNFTVAYRVLETK